MLPEQRPPSEQRETALPALIVALFLTAIFARLLSPAAALVARDLHFLHLPLRTAFAALAAHGLPQWNPWIHGGQPILSNPQYAAFYPPTWLALAMPVDSAVELLILAHAALAAAGAWRLARQLGADAAGAALAAVAFAGGGAYLSLVSLLNVFCAMAWFPWVLAWGDRALGASAEAPPRGALLGAATGLAAQVLAEGQVGALLSGLALLALAGDAAGRALRATRAMRGGARGGGDRARRDRRAPAWRQAAVPLRRLLLIALLAGGLAAAQILPTAARLPDSPRAGGLPYATATAWSTPPWRLIELLEPRAFGDAARDEEDLYFGWGLHDKDFPLLTSIYPGLLVTLLGCSALLRGPLPRRAAWAALGAVGLLLALGRHLPLYPLLHRFVPPLAQLRYPEKFLALAPAALAFAAALGWTGLLAARRTGERRGLTLPFAAAALWLAIAVSLAAAVTLHPTMLADFVRARSGLPPSPAVLAKGVAYLEREAWLATLVAAGTAALLGAARFGRTGERAIGLLAVALLGADLWRCGHNLYDVLPAARLRSPPPLAQAAAARRHRLFTNAGLDQRPEVGLRLGEPGFYQLSARLARLDPYSGNLWGLSYALHEDFDLMLTGWGRHGLATLHADWAADRERAQRLLGAWNVGTLVLRSSAEEMLAEARRTRRLPPPAHLEDNPYLLPRHRFVTAVEAWPTVAGAVAAARAAGYPFAARDWIVVPGVTPGKGHVYPPAQILATRERGASLEIAYRAPAAAMLISATTYDAGWRADAGGSPLLVLPTAIGQLAVEVPAGERRLVLEYRDPWAGLGLAVTALTALGCAFAYLRRRRLAAGTAADG